MSTERKSGEKENREMDFLSGNEAIARGAVESAVDIGAGYPGTPSTEALEALKEIKDSETYVEWSVNEKVAIEVAGGASWLGKRALATMKMSGLNVASDSFLSLNYSGTEGELVLYVADDPETHAGMCEQDTRYYAKMAPCPILDVSTPQESKDFVKEAFRLSKSTDAPVIVRSTTNIAHAYGNVKLGEKESHSNEIGFEKDISRYTKVNGKQQHGWALERLEKAREFISESELNPMSINSTIGVIGSGIAWSYFEDIVDLSEFSWLKVDTPVPIPEDEIREMVDNCDKILILEELEPIVEDEVRGFSSGEVEIIGKRDETLPRVGEYDQETVGKGLEKLKEGETVSGKKISKPRKSGVNSPSRPLTFCAGCPHRGTYFILNEAVKESKYEREDAITTGDIGCTIIGMEEPFESLWTEVAMGASIGIAMGFTAGGGEKPIIATLGDSTFYHAGLPALVNAVQHDYNITIIVLDNRITAMTGHQPSPSTGQTLEGEISPIIKPENIARGLEMDSMEVLDPFEVENSVEKLTEALDFEGPSLVVMREPCALWKPSKDYLIVGREECIGCKQCIKQTGCPALSQTKEEKITIEKSNCTACGLCSYVCPVDAIKKPEPGK